MIKHLSVILLSALILTKCLPAFAGNDDDRLRSIVSLNGQAEVTISWPGRSETDRLSRNVSIVRVKNNKITVSISPLTVEWFIAQKLDYSIVEREESKGILTSSDVKQAMEWDSYPTYTQYDSIMRYFASGYPALCTLDTIGTSVDGRLVLALKITGSENQDEFKTKVFYTSTMHGDETAGFILMLRLSEYLLTSYGVDSGVNKLLDNLEIWINPLANPDGTYRGGNEIINPTRFNANGYDLNRNFPDSDLTDIVRQKETTDMMKFLIKHKFTLSANFHSGSEVVNYPWDHLPRAHADASWFYSISRAFADTAHLYSAKGYMTDLDNGVTDGYAWYPVYGGRQDYVTGALHGREVTIELDSNYVCPADYLPVLWEYDRRSLIGYLENALFGIQGKVTNARTGEPVPAEITISGHDKDNSEIMADTLTGNFVRLIEPGLWNLTFSADGYRDTVIYNVSVRTGETTIISVDIEPGGNKINTLNPAVPFLYPNPAKTYIKAVLPESLRNSLNVRIFNLAGSLIKEYRTDASDGAPVDIDINNMASGSYIIVFTNISNNQTGKGRFNVIR